MKNELNIHYSYSGSDSLYRVHLTNEDIEGIYTTKSKRKRDMFMAELKARLIIAELEEAQSIDKSNDVEYVKRVSNRKDGYARTADGVLVRIGMRLHYKNSPGYTVIAIKDDPHKGDLYVEFINDDGESEGEAPLRDCSSVE